MEPNSVMIRKQMSGQTLLRTTGGEILHFWFREADLKHKTIHPKIMHISSAVFTDKQQKGENKGWYLVVNQQIYICKNINYEQLTEIVTYKIQ